MNKLFLTFIFILSFSTVVSAEVYSYVDASGVKHFSSSIEKIPTEYREQVKEAELPSIGKYNSKSIKRSSNSANKYENSKKVEVFVTSWCPHCTALEKELQRQDIRYTRYDVEKNSVGRRKFQQAGGGGVPLSIVGGQHIRGNNVRAIKAALGN